MACCEYVKMFKDDIDLSLRVGWKLNNTGSRPSTDACGYIGYRKSTGRRASQNQQQASLTSSSRTRAISYFTQIA